MSSSRNPAPIEIKAVFQFNSKGNRPAQEDYLLVDREKGTFVVSDGFGGSVSGVQASKTACEAVRSFLYKEAGDLDATLPFVLKKYFSLAGNVLFNSLIHANRKLLSLNQGKNIHEKGGASVLAGLIDGSLLALANVGNCRAWLFRKDQATQLVSPRSYGIMLNPFSKPEYPEYKEQQSVPLMALGMTDDLAPEITEYRLQRGDWLAVLTDGVPESFQAELLSIKQKDLSVEDFGNLFLKELEQLRYSDNAAISLIML